MQRAETETATKHQTTHAIAFAVIAIFSFAIFCPKIACQAPK
jgi:hypothetical protein